MIGAPQQKTEGKIPVNIIMSLTICGESCISVGLERGVNDNLDNRCLNFLKQLYGHPFLNTAFSKGLTEKKYYLSIQFWIVEEKHTNSSNETASNIAPLTVNRFPPPNPLDTNIRKLMDSIDMVMKGKWNYWHYMNKNFWSWTWYYIHGDRHDKTRISELDTLYVNNGYTPGGEYIEDGSYPYSIKYYPKSKKLECGSHQKIWLLKGDAFISDIYYEYWNGGNAGWKAYLYTLTDTIFKGDRPCFLRSPIDSTNYYLFLDRNYSGFNQYTNSFIIGKTVAKYRKSSLHKTSGSLIQCRLLNPKQAQGFYKMTSYFLYQNDNLNTNFKEGDTIFLRYSTWGYCDTISQNCVSYGQISECYPFKESQLLESPIYLVNTNLPVANYKLPCYRRILNLMPRRKHWKDPSAKDPVNKYLFKNGYTYTEQK